MNDQFLDLVAKRLATTSEEVRLKREELNGLDAQIKTEVERMGKKQSMSYEAAEAKIAELEYNHAHSSLSNAEERQFMRDVDALKKLKKVIKSNSEKQSVVDEIKTQRAEVSEQLRILRDTEKDLLLGYRRVKLAKNASVNVSDIVESPIEVQEDRVGAIIGKGGANLRNFESTYNVIIDTERQGGKISIMGTVEAIGAASEAILELANTISEEIVVKDVVLTTLLIDKASLINTLQEELAVKIDVSRAKGICKVQGHVTQLPEAVERIKSLDCIAKSVELDSATMPAIIGKGGANMNKISGDHSVQLDVQREAGTITVTGLRPQVMSATDNLLQLYDGLREVEDKSISANKAIIMGAVIGRGGATIKGLQQDLHVSLQLVKDEDGAGASPAGVTPDPLVETLCIRGNKEQVAAAKSHIMGLIGAFLSQSVIFTVPPSVVPMIVGKKGATLNGIRDKFPETQIDISGDDGQVYIHASNATDRDEAKKAIEAIVDVNFSAEVQFEEDSLIALKGKRGADLRSLFVSHSLLVDMNASTNIVKIKGREEHVREALKACDAFLANTQSEKVTLSDDGFATLTSQITLSGKGGSNGDVKEVKGEAVTMKRELEERYGVEVYVAAADKESGSPPYMKIRGSKGSIDKVKATVQAVLLGDGSCGSVVIDLEGVPMSSLIGKGGSTLKKLQSEVAGARIDLIKANNQMRVRGSLDATPAWVEDKKRTLLHAIDSLRSLVTVAPNGKANIGAVADEAAAASSIFSVDIRQDGNKFMVRGDAVSIEEARQYLADVTSGSAVRSVTLGATDFGAAKKHFEGDGFFSRLRAKFALSSDGLALTKTRGALSTVVIKSTPKAADKIRDTLRREAEKFLGQSSFQSVEVNKKAMINLHGLVFRDSMSKLGLHVELDKPAGVVSITKATPAGDIRAGMAMLMAAVQEWGRLNACVDIEEWMIIPIVGKAGANISALQEKTGVSIKVDRPNLCLDVQASSQDKLAEAVDAIQERLRAIKDGFFEGVLAADKFGAFLGKAGANITAVRKASGATIEVDSKDFSVRITGAKEKVEAAKAAVEPFLVSEEQRAEALRVAAEKKAATAASAEASEVDEVESAPAPPAAPSQPLSKSASKRARQKERQMKEKEEQQQQEQQQQQATAPTGPAAMPEPAVSVPAAQKESSFISAPAAAPSASVARTKAKASDLAPSLRPATEGPATATATAPAPAPAPAPAVSTANVMTKVSIAKNLVHSGMSGTDIALACQNFPWDDTRQAFIAELLVYNCSPELASAIADASGLTTAGKGAPRGGTPAHASSAAPRIYQTASVPTVGSGRPTPKETGVDPSALTEQSSTADILDALIGMGGGAGFKQTSASRSSTTHTSASMDGGASGSRSPVKTQVRASAPAPAPAPAPAATKPKSAWAGWAGI